MSLHEGHRDRLRARFLKEGFASFEPHNVLELLLFYAKPRCDTNELAHTLLLRFGSLSGVMDASLEQLMEVPGVGYSSAVLLKMIPQLSACYLEDRAEPGALLTSTAQAGAYLLPRFVGKKKEEFHMLALDDRQKILRSVCISKEGIVNAVSISVRQVVTEAIQSNATGVILAHNHPAGLALPSTSDIAVTRQIQEALALISVQLLDHIIVADNDFVSMADSGYLNSGR